MRTELDLQDTDARIISGVRGAKSKPFSKKFPNAAAMERWFESEAAGDCEMYEVRKA